MNDVVNCTTRSRMMRGIRGRDTKPELFLRRYLHSLGYRFRLHRQDLPGSPDLVLPRYRLALFVHGCFWHRHAGCFYTTIPKTRQAFWEEKFHGNVRRDNRAYIDLHHLGWRVLVVWECGFKHCREQLSDISELIQAVNLYQEWPSHPPRPRPA
ncbi:T/G mismatch-specific endonuclease [Franzmannia pantelleriensis]|uniref:Very short patch repair endonuclease n=1 Tax=Franzmannia pantelleriensis TaxID=48727 RepID=A0A1G9KYE8_9GAMM|nr:DNA mismatch endonuclease Vsr [Halomonas pantelleriensis]SDL54722.1 T/G mismatch-specific endonuclease [Halomonas pantelleriensis]